MSKDKPAHLVHRGRAQDDTGEMQLESETASSRSSYLTPVQETHYAQTINSPDAHEPLEPHLVPLPPPEEDEIEHSNANIESPVLIVAAASPVPDDEICEIKEERPSSPTPSDIMYTTKKESRDPSFVDTGSYHIDDDGESDRARLERLGRERPAKFRSVWAEIAFCYSVLASQIAAEYFLSGFNVLVPTLTRDLHIPASSAVWPASAFSLVTASFLLPFGRLADMYGGYPVYIGGLIWFLVWSIIAGFSVNELMLDCCRAMQGLGPAAFLPSGVMLLGSIYRPGPRKNIMFALYGGAAPFGFFAGIFFAGLTGSFLHFGWYFWIGAILITTTLIPAYLSIPSDVEERRAMGIKMDWWGSILIVVGLLLVVFAVTDASHAAHGWRTAYIYVPLAIGGLILCAAFYVEGWVAENPLLPFEMFKVPHLSPLFVALFFSYGVLGIFLLYAGIYMQEIMGATPLQVTAWFVPMSLGGVIISIVGGYVLHLLSGTVLIIVAALAWCVTSVLFAVAPEGANYWAYVFPAMIGATTGIDITFNVANVFISTSLSLSQQGLAGALISAILYIGIAFLLAFADVTQTQTAHLGLKQSYQCVFWYQLGCAVLALLIFVFFVRIGRATSELTVDERAELERDNVALPCASRTNSNINFTISTPASPLSPVPPVPPQFKSPTL